MTEDGKGAECPHCECPLPLGCGHFYGADTECLAGARTDPEWRVGLAIWNDLADRRGIKDGLEGCDVEVRIEIIETLGRVAIAELAKS